MTKRIKAHVHHGTTSVMTTRWTVLTAEAFYFLTVYNLGPVAMFAKEVIS